MSEEEKATIEKIKAEVKAKFDKEIWTIDSKAYYKTSPTGRKFYVKRFSTSDLAQYLGRQGTMKVSVGPYSRATFKVQVEVVDVRERYRHGLMDYDVVPCAGEGQAWVKAEDVTLDPIK